MTLSPRLVAALAVVAFVVVHAPRITTTPSPDTALTALEQECELTFPTNKTQQQACKDEAL